jgi:hypothetical protein
MLSGTANVLPILRVVERDGGERGGVPAVDAPARLQDVRRRRRVVHREQPRRDLQVQVALRQVQL